LIPGPGTWRINQHLRPFRRLGRLGRLAGDVDLDARMTVSYVMNQMLDQDLGDYRALGIVIAAYEGLDRPG
jgi:hypothetical protein